MSIEYGVEVEMFIENELQHSNMSNVMNCPYLKYVNAKTLNVITVRNHLGMLETGYNYFNDKSKNLSILLYVFL